LRYFAVAAPKHTADEEDSLFPHLRKSEHPAATEALAAVERLEQDHDEADAHHAAVDGIVKRWLVDDRLTTADVGQLQEHLARLQALYGQHITIEDQQIFPAAAQALDRAAIKEIGAEMAARRQVAPDVGRRLGLDD
jgi:hemerythrin-like domain-containing protein